MIASADGVSRAPATPCNARAAMSTPIDGDSAHSAEPIPNPATPAVNTRRSPSRSVSEPASRMSALSVSRYALDTHCWAAKPPPSSRRIAGSATLTAEESTPAIVEARIAETSASWRVRGLEARPSPPARPVLNAARRRAESVRRTRWRQALTAR